MLRHGLFCGLRPGGVPFAPPPPLRGILAVMKGIHVPMSYSHRLLDALADEDGIQSCLMLGSLASQKIGSSIVRLGAWITLGECG